MGCLAGLPSQQKSQPPSRMACGHNSPCTRPVVLRLLRVVSVIGRRSSADLPLVSICARLEADRTRARCGWDIYYGASRCLFVRNFKADDARYGLASTNRGTAARKSQRVLCRQKQFCTNEECFSGCAALASENCRATLVRGTSETFCSRCTRGRP